LNNISGRSIKSRRGESFSLATLFGGMMIGKLSLTRPFFLMLLVAVPTACGGGDDPDASSPAAAPEAAPAASAPVASSGLVEQGRQVYSGAGICFTCHGPEGAGTALGPNLTDDTWIWIENPQQDLQTKLAAQIRAGTPQPREFPAPMPAMGGGALSEEQLQAVAAYVASL